MEENDWTALGWIGFIAITSVVYLLLDWWFSPRRTAPKRPDAGGRYPDL